MFFFAFFGVKDTVCPNFMSESASDTFAAIEERGVSADARDIQLFLREPQSDEGRTAFDRLIGRYQDFIFRVALNRLRDPDLAAEIQQQVMVHAHQKIHQLRNTAAFSSWLHRMTCRMIVYYQTRKKIVASVHTLDGDALVDEDSPNPFVQMAAIEQKILVAQLMGRLKPLDRLTLEAFYFQRTSIEKMARDFSVPVGTIKRRLHDARQRLRYILEPQLPA